MSSTLEDATKKVRKLYGDDAVFSLKERGDYDPVDAISTGSLVLDWRVLGVGGFPRRRVTELCGNEGSGKTTVCLHAIVDAQQQGLEAVYIDAEHCLDLAYAESIGVDLTKLIISQPKNGEIALDIADALCKVPSMGIIVFDSAAALGSKKEQDDKFTDNADVGKPARMLNKFFRRNLSDIKDHNIAIVFTNQMRDKIGSIIPNQKTTTGGHGLQHYSSALVKLARIRDIMNKDKVKVGHIVKALASKNKVAPPKQVGEFKIWYSRGIDPVSDTLDIAVEAGIIKKRGAFYLYGDERLGHGQFNAIDNLREHAQLDVIRTGCEEWLKG